MKTIHEYEIVDHGIDNSSYFQGCGTSFTKFTDVATGIGDNPSEALADALESLAQNDWDTSAVTDVLPDEPSVIQEQGDCEDMYYYISVMVKEATSGICGSCGNDRILHKVKYADDSGIGSLMICEECDDN